MTLLQSSAVVLAALIVTGTASAQERKITRRDLPPAVARTVQSESRGARVLGFSEEKENGQTLYEAELMVNGRSRDLLIDTSGTVVEVEEQVKLSSLPAAVQAGLRAGAGRGKITKVESLTKRGQLVAYEAHVNTNGKSSEVEVGPDGKPLAHEQ
jgi:hypothetical protein